MEEETAQTLISHLLELRNRLLRAVIAWALLFLCLFPFANKLYALLARPLLAKLPHGGHMIATEVVTPFFVPLKVAMIAALLGALPYILYQAWAFVAPGLYGHERRAILPLVLASVILFCCGMAFAYFMVFPVMFGFIIGVAPHGVAVMTDIDNYLNFVLTMFIAFGVIFEVPIFVVALAWMELVEVDKFKEFRPYVIVGAFVIGAVVTPPDILSQTMLAIPLWFLYELGVFVAARVVRRKHEAEESEEYKPMSEEEIEAEFKDEN